MRYPQVPVKHFRRRALGDALLDDHEPRLAGDGRQATARIDGIEAHGHAVLHVAADRLHIAAAHVGDDVAMAGGAVDAPPRGARIGMAPGWPGAPGADEVARRGGIFAGRAQREGGAAPRLLAVTKRPRIPGRTRRP